LRKKGEKNEKKGQTTFSGLPPHRQRSLPCICYQLQPRPPLQGKEHPKGVRDISCVLLVEEKSALLRSTGKTGQKLVITLTPFTPQIPVPGYLENYLGWFRALDRSPGFNRAGTRVVAGNCGQATMASSAFARRA